MKQVTGKEELSVHLNGDEAMCFGSAFIASNFSSSFKVKHVYLTQHPKYDIRIKLSPLSEEHADIEQTSDDGEDSEDLINYYKDVVLFDRDSYLGQRKTINVVYDKGMKIEASALYFDDNGD
jgi:hypothetical protein